MNIVEGFLQVNSCDDETLARWARRAEERCGGGGGRLVWHELYRGVDDPWILRGAVSALARGVATCDLEAARWRLQQQQCHDDAPALCAAVPFCYYKLHIVEAALQRAHTEERIGYISPPLLDRKSVV